MKRVEIQDGDDEDKYKMIPPASSELELNIAEQKPNQGIPDLYELDNDGVDDQIRFHPPPKYAKTVRLIGTIEPEPLVDDDDATAFRQRAADDALEHLIAADFFIHDGFYERGNAQLSKAQQVLGRLFGKEAVPLEMLERIVSR